MARQDLAYAITVNDAELRLATQHVAAFNAELATSTVTGKRVDETFRSIGRRASQVGGFFTRNVTLPFVLGGVAAAKFSASYQTSVAKIVGLTSTTAAQAQRISDSIIGIGSSIISNQKDLADAAFRFRSVGFSVNQTIAALPVVAKAAAAGLGDVGTVADAVASALDAYGISGQNAGRNTLSASKAVAVLIGTITAGKIAPDELARSLGRVIPIANAMGVSFDQVGASIASMTRQGLNANLATTGLRAFLQTFLKAQPITEKALATIGTSTAAVRASLAHPKIGVFPTAVALRNELEAQGRHPIEVNEKTLKAAAAGSADALKAVASAAAAANPQIAKVFPNVRALTAFLILTGPRRAQNANIFAQLKQDTLDSQKTVKKAYEAMAHTDIGRFRLALTQLRGDALLIGPSVIKAGSGILQFLQGVFSFFQHLGPLKGVIKDIGIGLVLFGPIVSIFGRATQAASFGVTMWGRWQAAATRAAYAARGINVEEDALVVASRKATVQFEAGFDRMTAAANRTAAAVGRAAAATTGSVRSGVLAASGGAAILGKTSRGSKVSRAVGSVGGVSTAATPLVLARSRTVQPQDVEARIATLTARRAAQVEAAQAQMVSANAAVVAAQQKLNLVSGIGATGSTKLAAADLAQAKAAAEAAAASLAQAKALQAVIIDDEQLIRLTEQLTIAQIEQARFMRVNAPISAAQSAEQIAALESQIVLRQRILAGQQISARNQALPAQILTGGGFKAVDQRALGLQSAAAGTSAATGARIMATKWGTAVEGMRSTAKLGFDFIALSFATEVVGRLIFGGHKARDSVVGDFKDMATSATGFIAILGAASLGLGALSTRLSAAGAIGVTGGLRTLPTLFEGLSFAALGFRGKIALVLASLLGLHAVGVSTTTALDAAFIGMGVKGLLGSRLVAAGLGKIGLAAVASRAGIIGLSLAITDLLANGGPTKTFFGHLDEFFSKHIDKNIPFIGGWLSARDAHDAEVRLGKIGDAAKKTKNDVPDQLFKQLEDGLSRSGKIGDIVKAAEKQRDLGNEYAAEQLLAAARTKQQFENVKRAVDYLRSHGQAGVAELLDPVAKRIKLAKKDLDVLFGNIDTSIENAFEAHTARLLDAVDRQTQNILDNFDSATQKLQDNLKVKVNVKSLGETFTIKVNGKTPAERELEALDRIAEKRSFKRDIFDARQGLAEAFQIGDPNAIRDQQRALQDAETARKRFGLEGRAKTERSAADAQTKTAQESFANQRKRERQAIEDSRQTVRRNIEATRTITEQNLKAALAAQKTLFDRGKETLAQYQTNVKGIMARFNVSIAQAGKDGGKAYADQMKHYFDQLARNVSADLDKITAKATKTSASLALHVRSIEKNLQALGLLGVVDPSLGSAGLAVAAQAANNHTQTVTAAQAAKTGIPIRPAIITALKAINGGVEYARYGKFVPQRGRPNNSEYQDFLKHLDPSVRTELRSRLRAQGFVRAAKGAIVPGSGTGDKVPALLTPKEMILNRGQQSFVASALGMPAASPETLFSFISRHGARFATGGVAASSSSGATALRVPGVDDLSTALKKLTAVIARNAKTQQDLPQDPRTSELILGGVVNKKGKLTLSSSARLKKLRRQLDPVHIEQLVNSTEGGLPVGQKKALEAQLAREQAHAVRAGLITPTPTGTRLGGTRTLAPSREISPAAFAGGGHIVKVEHVTIKVEGAGDPVAVGRTVMREFQRVATHVAPQRRG